MAINKDVGRRSMLPFFSTMVLLNLSAIAVGQPSSIEEQPKPSRIVLQWNDPTNLVQSGLEQIAEELNNLFSGLGARFEWEVVTDRELHPSPEKIHVLLLPKKPSGWPLGKHTMGAATWDQFPVVRLFYEDIAHTLSVRPAPIRDGSSRHRVFLITRGIARVLSHEIVHVVAPDHSHASYGFFRQKLNRANLRRSKLQLDPGCTEAFLACMRQPHRQAEATEPPQ